MKKQRILLLLTFIVATNSYAEYSIKYSYNENGQLASVDGARQDINDTSHYRYASNGQLQSIINALGHSISYSNYNQLGYPQTITDHNGIMSTLTYTSDGQLASITTAGAKTALTYNALGLVTRVMLADNSWLSYRWDNANRLISVTNNLGDSISYTLDAQGNRTVETTSKGTQITRQLKRQFDELGRVIKVIGAANQTYQYTYDTHRKPITETDPKGTTTMHSYNAVTNTLIYDIVKDKNGYTYHDRDAWDNEVRFKDYSDTSYWLTYDDTNRLVREESYTRGLVDYRYDHANNLVRKIDGNNNTIKYTYDALNRLLTEVNPINSQLDVTYQYDESATGFYNIGQLTTAIDASGTTRYNYNNQSLVAEQKVQYQLDDQLLGDNHSFNYSYDKVGRLATIDFAGNSLKYTRNAGGQITAVALIQGQTNTVVANEISYQPFGEAISSLTWNNNLTLTRNYDLDGQLTQQTIGRVATNYQYDVNGNISQIADSQFGTTNYEYDDFNRLTKEQGKTTFIYSYDAAGNRVLKQENDTQVQRFRFVYGNQLYDAGGLYYKADNINNIISFKDESLRYEYDENNRFSKVTKIDNQEESLLARYIHNAYGERAIKVNEDGSISSFIYNNSGQLFNETKYDESKQKIKEIYWIWVDTLPIAQLEIPYSNGEAQTQTMTYIHGDHLNTPRWATDQNQKIVWTWNSDAYGNTLANEDPQNTGMKTTIPLRFAGQYFDQETGLHYNYFRTYNPDLGRYTQSDPIGLEGGWNTFTYVDGNPVNMVDSKGLRYWSCVLNNCSAGAVTGGATGGMLGGYLGSSTCSFVVPGIGTVACGTAGWGGGAAIGGAVGGIAAGVTGLFSCQSDDVADECDERIQEAKNYCYDQYVINNRLVGSDAHIKFRRCVRDRLPEECLSKF